MIHSTLQRWAMWLVWNGPYLGKFGPILFDFAMGQKGKLVGSAHNPSEKSHG